MTITVLREWRYHKFVRPSYSSEKWSIWKRLIDVNGTVLSVEGTWGGLVEGTWDGLVNNEATELLMRVCVFDRDRRKFNHFITYGVTANGGESESRWADACRDAVDNYVLVNG